MTISKTRAGRPLRRFAILAAVIVLILGLALGVRWYLSSPVHSDAATAEHPPAELDQRVVAVEDEQVLLTLRAASPLRFPAATDSNSPAVWLDGSFALINSDSLGAYVSRGETIETLSETKPIDLPLPGRPGPVWMEAVWHDPETGVLYGWYHFEPEDLDCYPMTAPLIGAAASYDGGKSWEDRGFVLENGYDYDCGYQNDWFVGGNGDFTVILDANGGHFYFVYSNYLGAPEEVGVAIARSAYEDRGQPGTVWKFYRGEWNEPGLGGRNTALFRSRTGWQGPGIDAFWGPSVHWNHYLGAYVALLNRATDARWSPGGIYITFSSDLVNWTPPEELFIAEEWYPQVIGLGEGGSDSSAGKLMRVFVGGLSTFVLEFSKIPEMLSESEVTRPTN